MKRKRRLGYAHTLYASYLGYVTQAIVNNFAPLLFLTFQRSYSVSLERITTLVTMNFAIQLIVDLLAARFVDRIGTRVSIVAAHVFSAVGLTGLAIFPSMFPDPYAGLLTAIALYAVGGGLIEVLVSPIVEACPTRRKEAVMSLLHSFYCWGHVFVVLVSTAFFFVFGLEHWRVLAVLWAALPLCNAFYFARVPLANVVEPGEGMSMRALFRNGMFWLFVILMICAGASEQGMSQWASAFAEAGLHAPKAIGDLAGPCFFAVMMGLSRMLYATFGARLDLRKCMIGSAVLCVGCYLLAACSPWAILSLLGCGLCGFSVGVLWPGTFSLAAKGLPTGGTAMFALLALAGDVGCASGPTLVGTVSGLFGDDLKLGLIAAIAFPVLTLFCLAAGLRRKRAR